MTMMARSQMFGRAALAAAVLLGQASMAAAGTTADKAAALITYPYVTVDPTNGVDTFIQLVNDDADPVDVKCFLENTTERCVIANATPCLSDLDCPSGDQCGFPFYQVTEFNLVLTARQPVSWQASSGRTSLPLPGNSGSIPAVPGVPFRGVLRCLALDAVGAPSDQNVLRGRATLETNSTVETDFDLAKYNAVGNRALPGGPDADAALVLGGPNAEYAGCSQRLQMDFPFTFAADPVRGDEVQSTLVVVPCAGNFSEAEFADTTVQVLVYNEFEQLFSTSFVFKGQRVADLTSIDAPNSPMLSVFSVLVQSTLGGRIEFQGVESGLIAMGIEFHRNDTFIRSAAVDLAGKGERPVADVLLAGAPPLCPATPLVGCKSSARANLSWSDRASDGRDRMTWQLSKGDATTVADLGQPQVDTAYKGCLYSGGTPTRVAEQNIPPIANWRLARSGVRYVDRGAAEDGVRLVNISVSRGTTRRIAMKGVGEALPDPDLLSLTAPVLFQLSNDVGACWESSFGASQITTTIRRNSDVLFEAVKK